MHYQRSEHFVSILFITHSIFKQQKFTQRALETDTLTFQVSKYVKTERCNYAVYKMCPELE